MEEATLGAQRRLATDLFNRTWELIESTSRTRQEDREMLASAFASRLHWETAGTDENRAVGDWLIAHTASQLGYGDVALTWATAAYDHAVDARLAPWLRASALEGLARAHATSGRTDERDAYVARAREALEQVDDPEDRDLIESQLRTVPGVTG